MTLPNFHPLEIQLYIIRTNFAQLKEKLILKQNSEDLNPLLFGYTLR